MTSPPTTEEVLDALVDRVNRRPHRGVWKVTGATRRNRALTVTVENPDGVRREFTFCQTSQERLDD